VRKGSGENWLWIVPSSGFCVNSVNPSSSAAREMVRVLSPSVFCVPRVNVCISVIAAWLVVPVQGPRYTVFGPATVTWYVV
jgi:hypothetical protein